jgi:hypothetical protein
MRFFELLQKLKLVGFDQKGSHFLHRLRFFPHKIYDVIRRFKFVTSFSRRSSTSSVGRLDNSAVSA